MKGNELFKVAVRSMSEISNEVLDDAGLRAEDVKLFIPHQANQRITDAVANKLNVEQERVYSNISMHGNTSSASIPRTESICSIFGASKPAPTNGSNPSATSSKNGSRRAGRKSRDRSRPASGRS